MMEKLPSLVAFGSLAHWPVPEQLHLLRKLLLHIASLRPIVQTLQEYLATLTTSLCSKDPTLNALTIESAAEDLKQWIEDGTNVASSNEQRNAMLMPMTIIAQAVQYLSYLRQSESIDHVSVLKNVSTRGGIQGFCAGLLTAVAVASSRSEEEIGIHIATSIKLAFCIGVYVDHDQVQNGGPYSTLAVRWREPKAMEDIEQLLEEYSNVRHQCSQGVRDL